MGKAALIRAAYEGLDRGDPGPVTALLDPSATWVGVADSGWVGATPTAQRTSTPSGAAPAR